MNPPTISPRKKTLLWAAILIVFHAVAIKADSTDGSTPLALKPGAPAGSYALSELENINPYNGSLNFRLPLLSIGGRGGAGYTMTLPLEQKWRINVVSTYLIVYEEGGNGPLPDPQVSYHYFPSANWWTGIKPGYGPGVMHGRVAQFDAQVCADSTMRAVQTLTRLTFTAPDGTEFELQDKQTDGAPASVGICDVTGFNRGRVFVTTDGSAATFISDQAITDYIQVPNGGNDLFYPSGYLLLRDGMRYRIDNGVVSWLRDRNGNKMTFTYDAFKRMTVARDSLNREVTVSYSTSSIAYDEIVYKGFGGTPRTLRVNYANLQDAGVLRSGFSIKTYQQLFPEVSGSGSTNYNPKVVRSVTLPNNRQYQFQYNSYGELARAVLPTGGAFEYDHAAGVSGGAASGVIGGGFDDYSLNVYRRLVTRRVYADGSALDGKTTFSGQQVIAGNTNYVLIDQFKSDGTTRISQQKVYYEGFATNSFNRAPTEYSPWKDGKEYQSDSVAENGSTVLRRAVRTWQQPIAGVSWPLTQAETNAAAKANNPQITQLVTTLEPAQANKVSKQTFAYDKYTNQTAVYEYDFGTGAAGSLVRRSQTNYLTSSYDTLNPSSTNPDLNLTSHIRNLPTQVSIFDGAGVERARSTTEYDNYVLDGADCLHSFHCGLQSRANISGFDVLFGTSYTMRGNPTRSTRYLLSNGVVTGSVSSHSHYDIAGNVIRAIDSRSTASNFIIAKIEYDDRFGAPDTEAQANSVPSELTGFTSFAFPTKVINALGHTAYAQFDYYLGQPVNGEDANGIVAAGYFNDQLDRPTQIRRAIGTGAANQTTFAYDDANRVITTLSDKDAYGDNLLLSKVKYDQLGRTTEARQYEGGSNYIVTETQYDALSRPFKTSNPFRPWKSESAVWTTQAFDALGRMVSVTTPDGATVATAYSGDRTLVTDQAGKQRMSRTNALGQLKDVWEITSSDLATEAISFPSHPEVTAGYRTTYDYNVLNNLKTVAQGSQTRTFDYDSLARLKTATNPESGTVTYEYDNNSNLKQKTDARNVTATYDYDALNRNTSVSYSDGTMTIGRAYDQTTNGKGRLSWEWQCANAGNCGTLTSFNYDALGRVADRHEQFWIGGNWGPPYSVYRVYDLAGNVTSQTYPSGHTVSYSYDDAGRSKTVSGTLGDGVSRSYAASFIYNARNQITQELFGTQTPLYHKLQYNIRGQLWDVRVSTGADINGSSNRGGLQYFYDGTYGYGTSGPDNNGNVLFANTYILMDEQGNGWAIHRQDYSYDSLNRLSSVKEYFVSNTQAESQQSLQSYSYDRWGNRTINPASWGTNINTKQFTVNTANNQLSVPAGQSGTMTYDNAGNLTTDSYSGPGNRIYDAENKIVAAQDIYAGWSYYTYNASGQRVRRKINNQETWQIYGIDGELVAEYAANGVVSSPKKEYGYRDGQLLVTADGVAGTNVALASNGGTATASSTLSPHVAGHVIDGARRALNGSGWLDNTLNSFPDWVEVSFNGSKTIKEIDVITQQDDPQNPVEPSLVQTFSLYGATAFDVQYWNGSAWATVPGANVTGNNKVWRQFTFSPITTSKIRVLVNAGADSAFSRVVEVEAWTESSAGNINWLAPDHLGTPRIIIDQTGSLANVKRHDYLPFGEELFAGTGGRTAAQGYSASDGVRQQFTLKERDVETGLDYFLARYYSAVQGRFMSPDEFVGGPDELFYFARDASKKPTFYAELANPQSLNKYQYCLNNPLRFIDPDGHQQQEGTGASIIDRLMKSLTEILGTLAGPLQRAAGTETAPEEQRRPGPYGDKYQIIQAYMDHLGEGMETVDDVIYAFDVTGAGGVFRSYMNYEFRGGSKTDLGISMAIMVLARGGGPVKIGFGEAKSLVGAWARDPVKDTIAASIKYHFGKHGAEVGASNVWQYLRKAEGFARNLRGARVVELEDRARRYIKNGYYLIKDRAGKIISYGRESQ